MLLRFLFLFGSESVARCEKNGDHFIVNRSVTLFVENVFTCNVLQAKFQFALDSGKKIEFDLICIF